MNLLNTQIDGDRIKLLPLNLNYAQEIFDAIDSKDIWTYLPCSMENMDDMNIHVSEAIHEREIGSTIPFVVHDKELNRIVGMTRLQGISWEDKSLEIGYTWYSTEVWRTRVNTECKYLLLNYCFEYLKTNRVQFRVDRLNRRSIQAVLRIGAKEEGVFRKDRILYNGRIRDTAFFSIIDDEWPEVKSRLSSLLTT